VRRASEWGDMFAKPADGWVNVRVTGVLETEGATFRKVIGSPGSVGAFLEASATAPACSRFGSDAARLSKMFWTIRRTPPAPVNRGWSPPDPCNLATLWVAVALRCCLDQFTCPRLDAGLLKIALGAHDAGVLVVESRCFSTVLRESWMTLDPAYCALAIR
jgi:hypothetical protein